MKTIEGNYNESKTEISEKVSIANSLKKISYIFKPELVSISKNQIHIMSSDSEDDSFLKIEGTQKEIEEIAVKRGWTRYISWTNNELAIPEVGMQLKHKTNKTLYTVTGHQSPTVHLCSRRGIISKVSEIDLINDFKKVS